REVASLVHRLALLRAELSVEVLVRHFRVRALHQLRAAMRGCRAVHAAARVAMGLVAPALGLLRCDWRDPAVAAPVVLVAPARVLHRTVAIRRLPRARAVAGAGMPAMRGSRRSLHRGRVALLDRADTAGVLRTSEGRLLGDARAERVGDLL